MTVTGLDIGLVTSMLHLPLLLSIANNYGVTDGAMADGTVLKGRVSVHGAVL